MTHVLPHNVRSHHSRPRPVGRGAFSVVELLVVIGIVALLLGVAVPTVLKAWKSSKKTTTGLTIQMLATGITAYQQDHGIYPPLATYASGPNMGRPIPGTGFSSLARCLLGVGGRNPGPLNGPFGAGTEYGMGSHVLASGQTFLAFRKPEGQPPTNTAYWVPFSGADGVDGPGFKLRRTDPTTSGDGVVPSNDDLVTGKTYGPYIDIKFPSVGFALRDASDNTILYYVATGRKPDLGTALAAPAANGPYVGTTGSAFYDASQNSFDVLPLEAMRMLLGDKNANGAIDAGETAAHTGPYLLWTAGDDGIYGFTSNRSDDVTNFTPPPEFVK